MICSINEKKNGIKIKKITDKQDQTILDKKRFLQIPQRKIRKKINCWNNSENFQVFDQFALISYLFYSLIAGNRKVRSGIW